MAKSPIEFKVNGYQELANNLRDFGSPRILGKIVGLSLHAGAIIPLRAARVNARSLGLGRQGVRTGTRANGSAYWTETFGRIPVALKRNRAYMARRAPRGTYRLNVLARGQRGRGIYKNRAPHAQLVEYGYTHFSGRRISARPFLGPALDSTATQTLDAVARRMAGLVNGLKFPTSGRGP